MAKGSGAISLTIRATGLEDLSRKLRLLYTAMQDYREPLKRSAKYIGQKTAQGFRYGGAETQWKPLSPITIRKKGSSVILVDTGRLRAEATSPVTQFYSNRVVRLTVPTEYGVYHQHGIGVPQRKFFVVTTEEERQIGLFVRAYLQKFTMGR